MAYSIYFYLRPGALGVIDQATHDHPCKFLASCFESDYQRKLRNDGLLSSWIKPRGDISKEFKLFQALDYLNDVNLVAELAADEWETEPSLEYKLDDQGFSKLKSLVRA